MTTERKFSRITDLSELENVFLEKGIPLLSRKELEETVRLVSARRVDRLPPNVISDIGRTLTDMHILVTGMPKQGKTITMSDIETEAPKLELPIKIWREKSIVKKPADLLNNDVDAMTHNFSYAISGLAQLLRNTQLSRPQINIYERGLIDHFVFANALNEWYGKTPDHTEVVDAFKVFFRYFLANINGIVICNSTPEVAIANGSKLPTDLLALLSKGYENFPKTLSEIAQGDAGSPILTINLEPENPSQRTNQLKRSIYTLISWNLRGKFLI